MEDWVSDNLHSILGLSDPTSVDYIIALSKSVKDLDNLIEELLEFDLPNTPKTHIFAEELHKRLNERHKKGPSEYQHREQELLRQKVENEGYNIIEEPSSEDNIDLQHNLDEGSSPVVEEEEENTKELRKINESIEALLDLGEDNLSIIQQVELAKLLKSKDKLDRDSFGMRLLKKDAKSQKSILYYIYIYINIYIYIYLDIVDAETIENMDYENKTEEERKAFVEEIKLVSRQKYLIKRQDQQLDLYKRRLDDEKRLYGHMNLQESEKEINEINQMQYDLALEANVKKRDEQRFTYQNEEEEDRKIREKKNYLRYEEEVIEKTEQEEWEESQARNAEIKATSADRAKKKLEKKNYDLLMENQVNFIQTDLLEGLVFDDDGHNIDKREGDGGEANIALSEEDVAREKIRETRESLPIYPLRSELLTAIRDHQILIIDGETGSGKTTQVPQYLLEVGYGKMGRIGVTQPRRVAAMSVAARVSEELNVKLGHEVGFSIRFEDCTSQKTIIEYMTDGMLLRKFLAEPDLKSYSVLIIDEAHERTLHTDVLFGLVKDIATYRSDLKLIISSATLDVQKFSEYFNDAPRFNIPGRRYPVDIMYTKQPEADYLEASVITILQIHLTEQAGDILVFLTGQEEIDTAVEMLQQRTRGLGTKIGELIVVPIYSTLPSDMQAKIFEPTPPGARKVVLGTNIAETSLTIDGIKYVIDCGFVKQTSFNPKTGMESLIVTPISKASANQRAGRAGRVAPGKCFRLYTSWSYQNELDDTQIPEIQRTNLGHVVLMLKSLGINDLIHFDFMDPPPAETLIRALEQLYALAALNDDGDLTKLGRKMAEFPLDPMLAKMLIMSEKYKCLDQVVTICAMLSVGNAIFFRPKEKALHADNAKLHFSRSGGDQMSLLSVYEEWKETNYAMQWCFENFIQVRSMKRARDIKEQLIELCKRVEIDHGDETLSVVEDDTYSNVRKAIASGYFYNTAKLQKSGNYKTLKNAHAVNIHPSSFLFEVLPKWTIYFELVYTSKEFMRNVIEINPEWLLEIAPHYYKSTDIFEDAKSNKKKVAMPKKL